MELAQPRENSSPEPTGFGPSSSLSSEAYFNCYRTPTPYAGTTTTSSSSMVGLNQQLYQQPYYYHPVYHQYPFYNPYTASSITSPTYFSPTTSLSVSSTSSSSENEDTASTTASTSSPSSMNSSVGSFTASSTGGSSYQQFSPPFYSNTSPDTTSKARDDAPCNNNNNSESEETANDVNSQKTSSNQRVKRRSRTCFTEYQLKELESTFERNNYPDVRVIDDLVERLDLSIERISVWFQNRRAREKKNKKKAALACRNAQQSVDRIAISQSINSTPANYYSNGYYQSSSQFYQQQLNSTDQAATQHHHHHQQSNYIY